MSSEELRSARSFTALSRYCPIPVVIEPQSIHAFRSEPFLAEKGLFPWNGADCGIDVNRPVIDVNRPVIDVNRPVIDVTVLSSAASTFYFTLSHFELSRGQLNFRRVGVSPRYRTFEECQGSLFSNTHTFTNTDTLTTDAPNAHLWSGPKADHSVPHKILVMLACR